MVCEEQEDDRSVQQNRYYWGVVLAETSQQASIEGQRWAAEAWHELFKRMFLGYEIRKTVVAGRRRTLVTRTLRSTTRLAPWATASPRCRRLRPATWACGSRASAGRNTGEA